MFWFLVSVIRLLISPLEAREIAMENLALRQQLAVMKRQYQRPRLRKTDRLFWVWLATVWRDWRKLLVIVRPETVVAVVPPRVPPLLEVDLPEEALWPSRRERRG
jgi:hypothetical protein